MLSKFSEIAFKCFHLILFSEYCMRHYNGVIMSAMATQITGILLVCSTVCSGADQRIHQISASLLAIVRGIHRWPMDSPHKRPVTRKMFPFWWRHHGRRAIYVLLSNWCTNILMKLQSFFCSGRYAFGGGALSVSAYYRADSRFALSQWETALLCNNVSH